MKTSFAKTSKVKKEVRGKTAKSKRTTTRRVNNARRGGR